MLQDHRTWCPEQKKGTKFLSTQEARRRLQVEKGLWEEGSESDWKGSEWHPYTRQAESIQDQKKQRGLEEAKEQKGKTRGWRIKKLYFSGMVWAWRPEGICISTR